MEKKFTKAPWFWSGNCLMGSHGEFASTHILEVGEIKPDGPDKALIAAAPEMFDVLESLEIGFRKRGAVDLEMLRIADGIKEILTKATAIN